MSDGYPAASRDLCRKRGEIRIATGTKLGRRPVEARSVQRMIRDSTSITAPSSIANPNRVISDCSVETPRKSTIIRQTSTPDVASGLCEPQIVLARNVALLLACGRAVIRITRRPRPASDTYFPSGIESLHIVSTSRRGYKQLEMDTGLPNLLFIVIHERFHRQPR